MTRARLLIDWVVLDDEAEAFGADRVRFSFEIEPNGALDCDDDPTTLTDPSYVVSKVQKEVVPVPGLSGWMLGRPRRARCVAWS